MKKTLTVISLLVLSWNLLFATSASVDSNIRGTQQNLSVDWTPEYKQTYGFFYRAEGSTAYTPITTEYPLTIESDDSGKFTGSGTIYLGWSCAIGETEAQPVLYLMTSGPLTGSDTTGTTVGTIDWSANWSVESAQGATVLTSPGSVDQDTDTDAEKVSVVRISSGTSSADYIPLSIVTDNLTGRVAADYKATIVLIVQSDSSSSGEAGV